MPDYPIIAVYLIEFREKKSPQRWTPWKPRDRWFTNHRAAKLERDVLLGQGLDPEYECRIVQFPRGRTYDHVP